MADCDCNSITIPTGTNGWSPLFAIEIIDPTTEVLKLVGWTGGTGSSPAVPTNNYLGATGFVAVGSAVNIRGTDGTNGTSGVIILDSYVNTTGVGNDNNIGESTLRTYSLTATGDSILSNDGDYLDIDIFYFYNKQATARTNVLTMRYKFGGATIFTDTELSALDLNTEINIKITRLNANSQFWVITKKQSDTTFVLFWGFVEQTTSAADLTISNDFLITADNGLAGANQVVLKKCVINKISI